MAREIFTYWLAIQLIGLAGLPLAAWLLRALPDRGHAFAKTFGLLLTGYLAWLAAMFGLAPFRAASLIVAAVAVAGLGVWATGGLRATLAAARAGLRARWPALLASEALFLAAMLAVVWMRAHDPTPWGTERPMDFAFFNAIQRSDSFPPSDPWLAGFSINYYYFGYLLMAAMAQLTGLDPAAAYNLALALLFALTAQGVAGLIANMMALDGGRWTVDGGRWTKVTWLFPLLGVIFVLVAGNQSGALQVALGDERVVALDGPQLLSALGQAARGERTITLPYAAPTGDFGVITGWERQDKLAGFSWWWPSRSLWDEYTLETPEQQPRQERRYVITEFPLFSFRLGDMHPHVMALPFGLLAVALALSTLARPSVPAFGRSRAGWGELALTGIVLGSLYAINSWDLPTYMLLYGAALALLLLRHEPERPWRELGRLLLLVVAAAYLLFLPFHLTFHSLVGGAAPWLDLPLLGRITSIIAPYPAARSGLHAFLIIFGLFAVAIVGFVYLSLTVDGGRGTGDGDSESEAGVADAGRGQESTQVLGIAAPPSALSTQHSALSSIAAPPSALSGIVAPSSALSTQHSALSLLPWLPPALLAIGLLVGFPLLALAGLGALALERAWRLRERPGESFALLLAALGCAVVFGTELIYIRDTFEGWSARFNTIFKFYYQVWLLWGALAPFALWWMLCYARGRGRVVALGVTGLTVALLAGALVYPWLTLGELGRGELVGLHGRTPREQTSAGAASIGWLRSEAPRGSVVLEAADVSNGADVATLGMAAVCEGAYNGDGFGAVSAATGLPTVLGWVGHQRQWRGGDPAASAQLGPRCADVDAIYRTTDANQARELLAKYGVGYVYVGGLEQRLYAPESLAKFGELGEPVFQQDEVTIYRLSR